MVQLFTSFLRDLTENNLRYVADAITLLDVDDPVAINELASQLYSKYALKTVVLLEEKMLTSSKIEQRQVLDYMRDAMVLRKCDVYTFTVPFEGSSQLFNYHASSFRYQSLEADISPNHISIEVVNELNSLQYVNGQLNITLDGIKWNLNNVNAEVKNYDLRLRNFIVSGIENRINEERKKRQEEKELGFPPRGPLYPIQNVPIIIKPLLNVQIEPIDNDPSIQYHITDGIFDTIIECVMYTATTMEWAPGSFQSLGEEKIRDHLLSSINGMLAIRGTGESFNHAGKTDILYSYQEHNVFIAECKIWNGKSHIGEGLEQLESYLSWDDTKTSLIVFYKNKGDMSNSIHELDASITLRSNYSRTISIGERGSRYLMKHPADSSKTYVLQTIFFNLSPIQ